MGYVACKKGCICPAMAAELDEIGWLDTKYLLAGHMGMDKRQLYIRIVILK
jgi:hypothetical protein